MDEQAAEALTPERAAEILRALTPEQQQAVGLYVNHVVAERDGQFAAHLKEQLRAQEERLNAEFLAELTRRTTPDPDDPEDLYASRDAVADQVLRQATQIDEHERHRTMFAQQQDAPAEPQISIADVERIAERVAQNVFRALATQPDRLQGQPHVSSPTPHPQLTPSFRRPAAYVPTIRR